MRFALLLLAVLQEGAPVAQDRERIRTKAPLTEAEQSQYQRPAAPAPAKVRSSYSVAVIPLEFSDQHFGSADLAKQFFGGLNEYFSRVSSRRFKLAGQVCPPVSLEVERSQFERKLLEQALGGLPVCDGVAFVTAGGMGARGSPLWPHRGVVHAGEREVDYLLVPETGAVGVVAHEFMHLLGLEDKYEDEKSSVADACIMGTGYSVRNPPPPCADCRMKLGWTSAAIVDPTKSSAICLASDPSLAVQIPLTPESDETLLVEMRTRLLVWHTGGGQKIELLGRFPTESNDRLTPFSDPPFRGRSLGARQVWITDIRTDGGKAWFRVGPESPLTPLEEWRRSHIGKVLKD